jgi:sulfur carrier protein
MAGLRRKMLIAMPDGSRREIAEECARIEDILKQLGINPEEVIVAKNGKIVPEEETAGGSDELKIVRFVHGG